MSGNKIGGNFNEYTFSSTATTQHARAFYFNDSANDGAIGASFWHPRIDAVDGNEPSVLELLKLVPCKTYLPPINSDMSALDQWSLGEGDDPSTDWSIYGTAGENSRELRTTPYGTTDVVWVGTDLENVNLNDGGFYHSSVPIDNTANYRISCWVKNNVKTSDTTSVSWRVLMGLPSNFANDPDVAVLTANTGLYNPNPYSHDVNKNDLNVYGEWHLYVSFIDAAGTSRGTYHPDLGIYDTDGNKVFIGDTSFEFSSTCNRIGLRAFHYNNTSEAGDDVEFYHPRIDKLDGNEPTIAELLSSHKAKYPRINYPEFAALADWEEGSGTQTPDWDQIYGQNEENIREYRKDPFDNKTICWVGKDLENGAIHDGGFRHKSIPCDNTKKYRYSVWMRKEKQAAGLFFGPTQNYSSDPTLALINSVNGLFTTNPYAFANITPQVRDWALYVFHIHPVGTATGAGVIDDDSGIYKKDGSYAGAATTDFVFSSTTTDMHMRCYESNNPSQRGEETLIWGPRIDIVDGTEPTIAELLNQGYPSTEVYGVLEHGDNLIVKDSTQNENLLNSTRDLDYQVYWNKARLSITPSATDTMTWENAPDICHQVVNDAALAGDPVMYGNTIRNAKLKVREDSTAFLSMYVKQDEDPDYALSGFQLSLYEITLPVADVLSVNYSFETYGGAPTPNFTGLAGAGGEVHYWGVDDVGNGWYRCWLGVSGLPTANQGEDGHEKNQDLSLIFYRRILSLCSDRVHRL